MADFNSTILPGPPPVESQRSRPTFSMRLEAIRARVIEYRDTLSDVFTDAEIKTLAIQDVDFELRNAGSIVSPLSTSNRTAPVPIP